MSMQEQAIEPISAADAEQRAFQGMDNEQLIKRWTTAQTEMIFYQERMGRVEMELRLRMDADGATALSHPDYIIDIKRDDPTYDQEKLYGLKELVGPEEWERVYTAPTTKPVPAKIDMTVLKGCVKFNAAIGEGIEAAKNEAGPGRLRIRPRPKK